MASLPDTCKPPAASAPANLHLSAAMDVDRPDHSMIVAESIDTEDDSAYGDEELEGYTTSLTSSVVNYPVDEYGRRYHAYRQGTYVLPNDESEQDRLDISHAMFNLILKGKLYLAPINRLGRVLDVGTGTGIWAIDIGDKHPESIVIGNDFSPIQPTWVPPNISFEVDDCEADWPTREPFDLIQVRYMCGSIKDWPRLVQQCYVQTAPNGWTEFMDFDLRMYSEIHQLDPNNAVLKMHNLIVEACEKIGRSPYPGPSMTQWMEEAGFQNIVHRRVPVPMGPWAKEKRMKEIGAYNMLQFLEGLEAFGFGILTKVLDWSKEEVHVLLADVRRDIKKKRVCLMFDMHIIYGQKLE